MSITRSYPGKGAATALLLLLAGLGGIQQVRAQYTCTDYHKHNCERSADRRFSINGQSKSASLQVGVVTELNLIIYRGQDYRISVCVDEKILGGDVAIRLVEKVREPRDVEEIVTTREPVLDAEGYPTGEYREVSTTRTTRVFDDVRKILWDNTSQDMARTIEFSCTATKRIMVEVIPAGPSGEQKRPRAKQDLDIGCAGILVEHMATPGLGF
jgi:hypothetical protein